jgi:SLOG cluster4 family
MRRRIVGVIGGDEEVAPSEAREVGAAIAEAGLILCTGGLPDSGDAVKNISMGGAVGAVSDARTIGFLPSGSTSQPGRHPFQLYVQTNLSSTGRNAFTGLTPDAMIVFPGSRGTLTEMAFAWARGTPVWLWRSRDFLRDKRRRHQTRQDRRGTVRDQMMDALAILSPDQARVYSVDELDAALEQALDQALDADRIPADLLRVIIARLDGTSTDCETGYPGRRDDPTSKRWFEGEVARISGSVGRDME